MFNNPLFLSREPFVVHQKERFVKKLLETETEEKANKSLKSSLLICGSFFSKAQNKKA